MNVRISVIFVWCIAAWMLMAPSLVMAKTLKVSVVSHASSRDGNGDLKFVFDEMLNYLRRRYPAMPYETVELIYVDYGTECGILASGVIAALTPVKFNDCSAKEGLRPLLTVKKAREPYPYYSSVFVVNNKSDIRTLESDHIKTLFLVDPNSASGYIAPIYKLYDDGVIKVPSVKAVQAKGWKVETVGRASEVISRVSQDLTAIGAVGTPSFASKREKNVNILLSYYTLPQDVIAVSNDLGEYEEGIKSWFGSILSGERECGDLKPSDSERFRRALENSSSQLTGVVDFTEEHQYAIKELIKMRDRVKEGSPILSSLDFGQYSPAQIIDLIKSTKVAVLAVIITVICSTLSVVFGLGYRWGRRQ